MAYDKINVLYFIILNRVSIIKSLSRRLYLLSEWRNIALQAFALSLPFLVFISGCTSITPKVSSDEEPFEQQPLLSAVPENWNINGRISIISGQENWYAKFSWTQQKQDFQLSFTGPLGETELQVSQIAQNVRLKTPGKEIMSHNLEQLLYQETGWEFPISSLRYWVQGYPNPDITAKLKYNKEQQISDMFQAGWHIQYSKRSSVEQSSGDKIALPKKIIATKQDIKIKLIITRWQFDDLEELSN